MVDTNIDNYAIEDILNIFNLINPTIANVTDVANTLIARMTTEGKADLVTFFTRARDKVLDFMQNIDREKPVANETTEDIKQIWDEAGFTDKSVLEPARYFGDASHVVAENKQSAQSAAGLREPIIATHIINIDSQYRSTILPYIGTPLSNAYNTQFTFSLSNPINKAVSIRLYSYHIPTTWYAFSASEGNNFFIYNGIVIQIPDGNYTPTSLIAQINTIALTDPATSGLILSLGTGGKITFTNNDLLSSTISIIFFVQANVISYNNCGNNSLSGYQTLGINMTLGWALGFRTTPDPITGDVIISINPSAAITANVPPNTYGPKYFTLSIEEYTNQRLTSGLYNIINTKLQPNTSITDYYNTIQVACKLREGSLTQAQLYAINAVTASSTANNNSTGFTNKLSGTSSGSAFAVIPLQGITALRPDPYVKFGADLAIYKRNYAKPIILQRFTVSLTDDKGILVNLYDNDWSFSLIVEEKLN